MALVSQRVDNILGGVSQSPDLFGGPEQWREQRNHLPAPEKGLQRRPPLLHTATLDGADLSSTFVQRLGHFNVIVAGGVVKVIDVLTGVLQTVIVKSGTGYLTGGTYKGISSGDTAIILNTAKTMRQGGTVAPSSVPEVFLYIRQGDYSTTYTVSLVGVTVTYTTPDNTGAALRASISTDAIATALATAITANASLNATFTVDIYGSTLRIVRKDATAFVITGSDGLGDQGMVIVNGRVQTFADLPSKARPGAVVEVVGSAATAFDNYYVQYSPDIDPGENGSWKEVVQPGAALDIDATTMPVRVVRGGELLRVTEAPAFAPSFQATDAPSSTTFVYIDAVVPGGVYPKGAIYRLIVELDGSPGVAQNTFNYTVTGETETAAQVATGLGAIIDAHAAYTAVVFLGGTGANAIQVGRTIPTTPPVITTTVVFDSVHVFWSPDVTMITNEHVGRTIVDLSTGGSSVITSNTTKTITAASLMFFYPGSDYSIRGTGEYFLVEQCPWEQRAVGDDITAPFPDFINDTADDLFIHQGRLGLVFGRNVVLSRAGELYNFFRQTATEILSSDPIDISAVGAGPSDFHSALEWDGKMFLFTAEAQYLLSGEPVLAPSTVSLTKVSEYHSVAGIRPVVAGQRIFFVGERSGYVHLMEYHAKALTSRTYEARDTGAEIPTYIAGSATALVGDDAIGVVLLATNTNAGRSLFCYSYRYAQEQLTHSAWGRWDFATGRVIALDIVDGVVGLIQAYAEGTFLNTLVFDPTLLLTHAGVAAYLDRHILSSSGAVTTAYDGVSTTWTLPYRVAVNGTEGEVVVAQDNAALTLTVTRPAANQVSAVGDYRAQVVHIGVRYASSSTFPTVYVRDTRTGIPETRGRLQVRFLRVYYTNLTRLVLTVSQVGRAPQVYTQTSSSSATGSFLVPVQSKNDDCTLTLVADSAGADTVLRYEWEGTYHTRATRF